jgi:hypothetical protein
MQTKTYFWLRERGILNILHPLQGENNCKKVVHPRNTYVSGSVSLFPVTPTLEHRASMKRFVSLKFLNPKRIGRTPWIRDQPVARPLPTQTQNKRRQTSMPWMGFESTNLTFERAKTFHALDRAAMVIGCFGINFTNYVTCLATHMLWSSTEGNTGHMWPQMWQKHMQL